ncbi:OmpA family protein [Sorangium sp. So ce1036]|uniref:OmpA family protein n=1 Tax=Sorangium sp. So ce1036 TaxID=3133328 RepID=UPI003F0B2246
MRHTTMAGKFPAWFSRRPAAVAVRLLAAGVLALATPGCLVRQELYDEARAEIRRAREEGSKAQAAAELARAEAAQRSAQVAALEEELARLADDLRARDLRLSEATTTEAGLARQLDELAALNAELSARLRSAGQSVGQLASERGSLSAELAETRARLDALRQQQAAAEARAARVRDLVTRLDAVAAAAKVRVGLRAGQVVIEVPSDVLFDAGRAGIKRRGRAVLAEIAKALRTMPDQRFQVAGHTDDRKVKSARFPSSWELTTARAVAVVQALIQGGVAPRSLSAAGYGEFAPAAANTTQDGRARNRRIEILLVAEPEAAGEGPGEAGAAKAPAAAPAPAPAP